MPTTYWLGSLDKAAHFFTLEEPSFFIAPEGTPLTLPLSDEWKPLGFISKDGWE
jgi:hypothetical protein